MNQNLLELNNTTDDQLVIIREFNAPIDLVFEVLTNHDHIMQWSCPDGMHVTFSKGKLKVGEKYQFGMQSDTGGPEMILSGEYRIVEPPSKLVYTQVYVRPNGVSSPETIISVTLEQIGDKTQMLFHHTGFLSKENRDQALSGWPSAFDKLENLVNDLTY